MGLPPFPSVPYRLDPVRIRAAYAAVRSELAADPLFIEDAADFDVSLEALDTKMKTPPSKVENILQWLDGADQYRYAAQRVLSVASPKAEPLTIDHSVAVSGVTMIPGDVKISGSLLLEDGAALIVLGTLHLARSLLASPWDYTWVGGGQIVFGSGISAGEIIATEEIVFEEALYLAGNDHSCRSPLIRGGTLVDFERGNAFRTVDVAARITNWDFDAAAIALGVSRDDGDLRSTFFKKLAAADALSARR